MCDRQTLKLEQVARGVTMLTLEQAHRRHAINQELGRDVSGLADLRRRKIVAIPCGEAVA